MTTTRRTTIPATVIAATALGLGACGSASTTPAVTSTAATPSATATMSTPATTSTPAATSSGTPAGTTTAPTASGTSGAGAGGIAASGERMPVYLARTDGGSPLVYREYLPAPPGAGDDADRRATVAVAGAMSTAVGPYAPLWGGRTVASVRRAGSEIVVTCAGATPTSTNGQAAQAAVAQVVWTATAAYGKDLPVRFVVPGGATALIGDLTTARTYTRATFPAASVLAPIWIDSPALGERVSGPKVTAKGAASVFEGTVAWQVLKDGAGVRRGVVTASEAGPGRGQWTADLGTLEPGEYTLVASADDPSGKGKPARTTHTFTVR